MPGKELTTHERETRRNLGVGPRGQLLEDEAFSARREHYFPEENRHGVLARYMGGFWFLFPGCDRSYQSVFLRQPGDQIGATLMTIGDGCWNSTNPDKLSSKIRSFEANSKFRVQFLKKPK